MIRESLADNSIQISALVRGNRIRIFERTTTGGSTHELPGANNGAPEWLRIVRTGNTFDLYRSNSGSSWTLMQSRTVTMGTNVYIGMAVTGNSTTTLATGTFDNVTVTGGGGGGPTATPTATSPSPTATPTNTPTPTATSPGPTATATPSPPPTPSPTPPPPPAPDPEVVIQRVTFSLAGQAIAVKVSGDPTSDNNGIFYLFTDHLGSTVVLTKDSDGYILADSLTRYMPFGEYRGTAPSQAMTDQGYTGQKENMEIGLIYYNARFYVPGIGRFASADTIVPNPTNPQSFNRYSYVRNNPINFSDPTGNIPCETLGTEACTVDGEYVDFQSQEKQYDVTEWLASEMVINVNGPEMAAIQNIFQQPKNSTPMNGTTGIMPDTRFLEVLAGPFYELNKGFGLWDIKRKMKTAIGEGITLCGLDGCGWFDYSTPGNIHFGFIAAATDIPKGLSLFAGGALEIKEGSAIVSNWQTLFEDPRDWAAVQFGYQLYETYGSDMVLNEFQTALTADIRATFQPSPISVPSQALAQRNGFSPGAFNYQGQ